MAEQGRERGVSDRIPRGAKPPRAADEGLGRRYGIGPREFHDALEKLKDHAGLLPSVDTLVDNEGNLSVKLTGEWIGNLVDEV